MVKIPKKNVLYEFGEMRTLSYAYVTLGDSVFGEENFLSGKRRHTT